MSVHCDRLVLRHRLDRAAALQPRPDHQVSPPAARLHEEARTSEGQGKKS